MSNFKHIPVELSCKLFDNLIRPIILYNSEIWYMDDYLSMYKALQRSNVSGKNVDILSFSDKPAFEKVHNKFCKSVLGVRKTSCNIAAKSELGRLPLDSFIKTQVICYFSRLNCIDINPLVKEAFYLNKNLHTDGVYTWYSFARSVMTEFEIDYENFENDNKSFKEIKLHIKREIKKTIKEKYDELVINKISSFDASSKLYLYSKLKSDVNVSDYLNLQNFNSRRILTKLRISDHNLEIELGRYKNIPREQRLCKSCKITDDEAHFFFHCQINNNIRRTFIDFIQTKYVNFNQLDAIDKLIFVLNPNMDVLPMVVDFVKQSFELRQ